MPPAAPQRTGEKRDGESSAAMRILFCLRASAARSAARQRGKRACCDSVAARVTLRSAHAMFAMADALPRWLTPRCHAPPFMPPFIYAFAIERYRQRPARRRERGAAADYSTARCCAASADAPRQRRRCRYCCPRLCRRPISASARRSFAAPFSCRSRHFIDYFFDYAARLASLLPPATPPPDFRFSSMVSPLPPRCR